MASYGTIYATITGGVIKVSNIGWYKFDIVCTIKYGAVGSYGYSLIRFKANGVGGI